MSEKPCGAYFFAFFEKFVAPILTSGGLAAVSSSAFAALYSAFGKYDVVHIHAEGPAFFAWLPKMFGKRVVVTVHGIDWQREKWQSGLGSKFIHQGEKNAAKYADEVIVLSKGVQDYFKERKMIILFLLSALLGILYMKYKHVFFLGGWLLRVVLAVVLLLLFSACTMNISFEGRLVQLLGNISYEFYLGH